MNRLIATGLLLFGFALSANADVWKWVDASGKTHFVDTITPIYTWVDEFGKVHYSDTPGHEDAVSVELVWVSPGSLADVDGEGNGEEEDESGGGHLPVGPVPPGAAPRPGKTSRMVSWKRHDGLSAPPIAGVANRHEAASTAAV
mgnify:CR=1 FL=1